MPRPYLGYLTAAVALCLPFACAQADDLADGWVVDLRFRAGNIDESGFARAANPDTLRATLGYLWKFAPEWSAYAEGSRVFSLFGQDYNSGANGKTNLPAEGDPPSSEISSAWVGYDNGDVQARLGRQYVNLDDQRFFTSGLWRQNPQSFDALSTSWQPLDGTQLQWLHLDEAHRTVGNDYPVPDQRQWSLDANLLHVDQQLPLGKLVGYDYFVDNRTQATFSWRTAGLRWTGDHAFGATALNWTAEFAQQSNYADNPLHYTADYHLFEAGYGVDWLRLKLGDEMLGGNGHAAFSSPYGSNHAFNGWTSQFKTVPANGLDDRYAGFVGNLSTRLSWELTGHDFFAQRTAQHYGQELNAGLKFAARDDLALEFEYADYRRDTFGVSERALWAAVEYKRGTLGGE